MKKYAKMVAWVLSFQLVSGLIGWAMRGSVDGWYQALNRSSLTPPGYVFGFVWPILYVMLAVVGWYIWDSKESVDLVQIRKIYIFQMFLNWSWTPVFFNLHMMGLSVLMIALMIITTLFLMIQLWGKERFSSALLLPYFMWLSFAFYLNLYTFLYN